MLLIFLISAYPSLITITPCWRLCLTTILHYVWNPTPTFRPRPYLLLLAPDGSNPITGPTRYPQLDGSSRLDRMPDIASSTRRTYKSLGHYHNSQVPLVNWTALCLLATRLNSVTPYTFHDTHALNTFLPNLRWHLSLSVSVRTH